MPMESANIKDIAQMAGVSVSTVSRVINNSGYASEHVRNRVKAAAEALDYRPSMMARGLKNNTSRTIGLIVTDITNPFFASIAKETEDLLSQCGYSLIICSTSESPEKELRHLKLLFERHVDGILLCSTGKNNDYVQKMSDSGVAIIQIDREYKGLNLDVVKDDNLYGAEMLTNELIKKGHTHIALIKGHPNSLASAEREQGYLNALKKHGIKPQADCIFSAGASGEDTDAVMERLFALEPRPTAILALNASIAKHIISYLNVRGLRIPHDIALASYGLEEFKTLFAPPITCVIQRPERYGEIGTTMMMERLKNGKSGAEEETLQKIVLFAPELFVGESI